MFFAIHLLPSTESPIALAGQGGKMKRIIWICLVVLFIAPTLSQAGILGPVSIRYTDGDVMFRTPDDDEWLPAATNTPLDEGDAVWCPDDSRVEIQLPDGSIVRLDGGSQLDLIANEDGFTHLHLASGRLYIRTSQTSGNNSLQIDADDTTVVPAARTRLRIDMLPNNQEDVSIFKGTAYVEGNGSRTKVRAGEQIALEEGHNELLSLNPSDDWEYWNVDRDRAQSRSARSDSYLPDELRGHSADLDANGTWERVPEYGMVWRPTVMLSDDWAPYRSGRWIWKGDDYVWISYENWGWVPYHYGRWAVVSGLGWCWVPPTRGDVYWGPGYVGWYTAGNNVGWTPLAPGEIYTGRRYYGSQSRIISNTNNTANTVVYRNRNNRGGLTVVQHNDFLRGRTVVQQPSRNTSVSLSVSIGSPRIQPLRETRMPIIKQTPPRVAPPRIERRDTRQLRDRFPRVIPEAAPQRRREQAAPVAAPVPAAPTNQTAPVREKRTVYPAVVPNGNRTRSDRLPQETPSKRDEQHQRTTVPQPAPQPVPTASGTAPQRPEQPRRGTAPVITPAAQPQPEPPKREENRQRPAAPRPVPVPQPAPAVSGAAPQRTEQPRRAAPPTTPPVTAPRESAPQRGERAPRDVTEKKVWKVTTPENPNDRDNKEKDQKGRERR